MTGGTWGLSLGCRHRALSGHRGCPEAGEGVRLEAHGGTSPCPRGRSGVPSPGLLSQRGGHSTGGLGEVLAAGDMGRLALGRGQCLLGRGMVSCVLWQGLGDRLWLGHGAEGWQDRPQWGQTERRHSRWFGKLLEDTPRAWSLGALGDIPDLGDAAKAWGERSRTMRWP